VHFGTRSPGFRDPTWIWTLFLDVSGARAFRDLRRAPFFSCAEMHNSGAVCAAFEKLSVLCRRARAKMPRYPTGPVAFAPAGGRNRPSPHDIRVKSAVLELLGCLLEGAEGAGGRPEELLPEAVRRALTFMALRHADPDLRLGDIAGAAHLSVDHFGRVFRRYLHRTPMRHLTETRIGEARVLLRQSNALVEEVARKVGFESPFHFSRTFRRITGLSPTAFRERWAATCPPEETSVRD
jgi:AraC-like DNA-binding protein